MARDKQNIQSLKALGWKPIKLRGAIILLFQLMCCFVFAVNFQMPCC
jgi:hypothetical protein